MASTNMLTGWAIAHPVTASCPPSGQILPTQSEHSRKEKDALLIIAFVDWFIQNSRECCPIPILNIFALLFPLENNLEFGNWRQRHALRSINKYGCILLSRGTYHRTKHVDSASAEKSLVARDLARDEPG